MSIGPNMACSQCGARPYPELSLPDVVRQTYDLRKGRGGWRCELCPRPRAPKRQKSEFTFIRAEVLLGELARLIANMKVAVVEDDEVTVDKDQRSEALELVESVQTIVAKLKSGVDSREPDVA
jgi:hypothetical protein